MQLAAHQIQPPAGEFAGRTDRAVADPALAERFAPPSPRIENILEADAAIWSALFAVGNFLYGRTYYAAALTVEGHDWQSVCWRYSG